MGEGGNLGFTRRARVEYPRAAGASTRTSSTTPPGSTAPTTRSTSRSCSGSRVARGDDARERDELLRGVTEDVAEHVLYDSFLQAQIIGQEVERSAARLYAYDDLMGLLEEEGAAQPRSENLPTPRRSPTAGARARDGAARAGGARRLRQALGGARALGLEVHRRPVAGARPARLLPARGHRALRHLLADHPLRASWCMVISNSVVNALGPTFVSQVVAERGCEPADVVRAYRIARAVTGAAARWDAIERLEGSRARGAGGADGRGRPVVDSATRWYLVGAGGRPSTVVAAGRAGVERLAAALPELGRRARARRERADRLVAAACRGRDRPAPLLGRARARARHGRRGRRDRARGRGRRARSSPSGAALRLDWIERELDGCGGPRMRLGAAGRAGGRLAARRDVAEPALAAVSESCFRMRRAVPHVPRRGASAGWPRSSARTARGAA